MIRFVAAITFPVRHPGVARARWRERRILADDARRWARSLDPSWAERAQGDVEILFASFGNAVWWAKQEAILAKSFALHGHRAAFLVRDADWRAREPYAAPLGVNDRVDFDMFLAGVSDQDVNLAIEGFEAPSSVGEANRMAFHGVPVGRYALASVFRGLKAARLDLTDPTVGALWRDLLQVAVRVTLASERLFDELRPRVLMLLERGDAYFGPVSDVALRRGVDVVQYTGTHRSDAFALKRYGVHNAGAHPFSLGHSAWGRVRAAPWAPSRTVSVQTELLDGYTSGQWFKRKYLGNGRRELPPDEARALIGVRPGRKIVGVFPHISWDATFTYGRTLFGDYDSWFAATLGAAAANTDVDWAVKVHPDHVWKAALERPEGISSEMETVKRVLSEPPSHVHVIPPDTPMQTSSLFRLLDAGVTVRGTIGWELACFGIPVLTGGTGRYDGLGYTVDAKDEREFLHNLARVASIPRLTADQTELACRHAHALLHLKPWRYRTFASVNGDDLSHPLAIDVKLLAKTPAELREAAETRALVSFVLVSDDEDHLAEEITHEPHD